MLGAAEMVPTLAQPTAAYPGHVGRVPSARRRRHRAPRRLLPAQRRHADSLRRQPGPPHPPAGRRQRRRLLQGGRRLLLAPRLPFGPSRLLDAPAGNRGTAAPGRLPRTGHRDCDGGGWTDRPQARRRRDSPDCGRNRLARPRGPHGGGRWQQRRRRRDLPARPPPRRCLHLVPGVCRRQARRPLLLERTRDAIGYLEDLMVLPQYRLRGIATALVQRRALSARSKGAAIVFLPADANDTPKRTCTCAWGSSPSTSSATTSSSFARPREGQASTWLRQRGWRRGERAAPAGGTTAV